MTALKRCCRIFLLNVIKLNWVKDSKVFHFTVVPSSVVLSHLNVWWCPCEVTVHGHSACHGGCFCLTLSFIKNGHVLVRRPDMNGMYHVGRCKRVSSLSYNEPLSLPNKTQKFQGSRGTKCFKDERRLVYMHSFSFTNLHVDCQELSCSLALAALHIYWMSHVLVVMCHWPD